MRRHTSFVAAALCLAAVSAAPTPAHAQLLKRIKQAAAEKIADKAVDKAADKAGISSSTAPADTASASSAPASVNRGSQGVYAAAPRASAGAQSSKVEITNDRITQFIEAMGPVLAAGREVRAERAAKEQLETYQKCSAGAMLKGPGNVTDAQSKESERLAEEASKLSGQMLAGGSRDTVRINQLNDSMQVLMDKQMRIIYPAIAKCGARPAKRASGSIQTNYDGTISNLAPSRVAGMTPAQFGRMRERIALYLVAPQKPNDLSPDERSALDARSKDLAEITAGFKSNLYNWQTWSEIWNAWK